MLGVAAGYAWCYALTSSSASPSGLTVKANAQVGVARGLYEEEEAGSGGLVDPLRSCNG